MSLSNLFKQKSAGSYSAKIEERSKELLTAIQRDLDILKARATGGGGWFGKSTTGQFNEESGYLVYSTFKGITEKTENYSVRTNQSREITTAVREAMNASDELKDIHDFCARDDIDIRIEHVFRDDFIPNGMGASYREVEASLEIRTQDSYRSSTRRLARPAPPKPPVQQPPAPMSAKERLTAHLETLSAAQTEELLAALTTQKKSVEVQPAPEEASGLRTVRAPRIVIQKRSIPEVKKP